MPKKNSYITFTDQFCGAGGSSQGVRNVAVKKKGGIEVRLALNHWALAIETHNTNFPDTLHDCTDISAAEPRRYPSTDFLLTSPECTNHSLAKGRRKGFGLFDKIDPSADRSRATMWDVPRFAEFHNYNVIIVENVVDARSWVMWDAWLQAMHALGYLHRCVYINSMHAHPTPQSRDRMYVVFWKKGNKAPDLEFTPKAWCVKCEGDVAAVQWWKNPQKKWGKYRQQYVYRCPRCASVVEPYYYASFNCIDWSDIGTRIGDRKKPLSPNTITRVNHGRTKYGGREFIIHAAYSEKARGVVRDITDPANTIHTDPRVKLVMPFIIKGEHSKAEPQVRPVNEPMQTQVTRQTMGLVTPPFLIDGNYDAKPSRAKSVTDAMDTMNTHQRMGLVVPWIIEMNRTGECKPASEATATMTAGGINHAVLIENKGESLSRSLSAPMGCQTTKDYVGLLSYEAANAFLSYSYNGNQTSHISETIDTVTTKDRAAIIQPAPSLEDCYYRMLKPHEIQAAMAFDRDYIILGSQKDKVKQLGNAVTPPAMEWLVERCIESLM